MPINWEYIESLDEDDDAPRVQPIKKGMGKGVDSMSALEKKELDIQKAEARRLKESQQKGEL